MFFILIFICFLNVCTYLSWLPTYNGVLAGLGFVWFVFLLLFVFSNLCTYLSWLPTNNGVLAGLREDKVSKPTAAVDIIPGQTKHSNKICGVKFLNLNLGLYLKHICDILTTKPEHNLSKRKQRVVCLSFTFPNYGTTIIYFDLVYLF